MKTRYFIQSFGDAFDIYTENGSFAQCYTSDGTWKTKYYKESWKDFATHVLESIAKPEIKDWETSAVPMQTMIADAIEYMESGAGYGWDNLNRVDSLDEFKRFTKADIIERVNKSCSSIFSKEDVIKLITLISPEEIEVETEVVGLKTERLQELVDDLRGVLDDLKNGKGIEADEYSTEFVIRNGNEIRLDNLELDTDELSSDLEEVIERIEKEFLPK